MKQFGRVLSVHVICHHHNRKSKGYAFVTFSNGESVKRVIRHGSLMMGNKRLFCDLPKDTNTLKSDESQYKKKSPELGHSETTESMVSKNSEKTAKIQSKVTQVVPRATQPVLRFRYGPPSPEVVHDDIEEFYDYLGGGRVY